MSSPTFGTPLPYQPATPVPGDGVGQQVGQPAGTGQPTFLPPTAPNPYLNQAPYQDLPNYSSTQPGYPASPTPYGHASTGAPQPYPNDQMPMSQPYGSAPVAGVQPQQGYAYPRQPYQQQFPQQWGYGTAPGQSQQWGMAAPAATPQAKKNLMLAAWIAGGIIVADLLLGLWIMGFSDAMLPTAYASVLYGAFFVRACLAVWLVLAARTGRKSMVLAPAIILLVLSCFGLLGGLGAIAMRPDVFAALTLAVAGSVAGLMIWILTIKA